MGAAKSDEANAVCSPNGGIQGRIVTHRVTAREPAVVCDSARIRLASHPTR
ncbi:MAG: hypothetical protein QOJ06_1786 [Pseudonocardiales bacterium]|jgi:hypothetical protein|nr:hypothetical protein [Pseudonocardiales bacterium]